MTLVLSWGITLVQFLSCVLVPPFTGPSAVFAWIAFAACCCLSIAATIRAGEQ